MERGQAIWRKGGRRRGEIGKIAKIGSV